MKKGIKISAATVMVLSAITPVAAFAAEPETTTAVKDGYYINDAFITAADFAAKTKKAKAAFIKENITAKIFIVLKGKVYDLTDVKIQNAKANEVENLGKPYEVFKTETGIELTEKGVVLPPVGTELKVESVSAINATSTSTTLEGVEAGAKFKVVFGQAVDPATVTVDNFAIKKGTTVVASSVTVSTDGKEVTVTPLSPLEVNGTYTLTVSENVALKADTTSKLGTAVTKEITVADSLALSGLKINNEFVEAYTTSTGALSLVFNKDLDQNSVNTGTVKLYNKTKNQWVVFANSAISFPTTKTVTIQPPASYLANNSYELTVDGVKSLDGKQLNAFTKTYGVSATPTATQRTNTATPASFARVSGLKDASIKYVATSNSGTPVLETLNPFQTSVLFAQDLNKDTVTPANIYLAEADADGKEIADTKIAATVTYTAETRTAVIKPESNLKDATKYRVFVTADLKNAFGAPFEKGALPLVAGLDAAFITDDVTAPTVKSNSVTAGRVAVSEDIVIHFSKKLNITPESNPTLVTANLAGAGVADFTTTAGIRLVDLTDNRTVNASVLAGLQVTYKETNNDPRLVITKPTAGWTENKSYRIDVNGYDLGETTLSFGDALNANKTHSNLLAADYSVEFATEKVADTLLSSVKVGDKALSGLTNVASDSTYTLEFAKDVKFANHAAPFKATWAGLANVTGDLTVDAIVAPDKVTSSASIGDTVLVNTNIASADYKTGDKVVFYRSNVGTTVSAAVTNGNKVVVSGTGADATVTAEDTYVAFGPTGGASVTPSFYKVTSVNAATNEWTLDHSVESTIAASSVIYVVKADEMRTVLSTANGISLTVTSGIKTALTANDFVGLVRAYTDKNKVYLRGNLAATAGEKTLNVTQTGFANVAGVAGKGSTSVTFKQGAGPAPISGTANTPVASATGVSTDIGNIQIGYLADGTATLKSENLTTDFVKLYKQNGTEWVEVSTTAITDVARTANATATSTATDVDVVSTTNITVTDSSVFRVGDSITITDGAGAGAGNLATTVTAINPAGANTITIANAVNSAADSKNIAITKAANYINIERNTTKLGKLDGDTLYKVWVSGNILDSNGSKFNNGANYEYTFKTSDTTAPVLTSTTVKSIGAAEGVELTDGATGVDRRPEITLNFDEKVLLDGSTVGTTAAVGGNGANIFVLEPAAGGAAVTIDVTVDGKNAPTTSGSKTYVLKPQADLAANTSYRLVVKGDGLNGNGVGVVDLAGNSLAKDIKLTFTTGEKTTQAPVFTNALKPVDENETAVTITNNQGTILKANASSPLVFGFDKAIDISSATVKVRNLSATPVAEVGILPPTVVAYAANADNKGLSVRFAGTRVDNNIYEVTIKGVKDTNGNVTPDIVVYLTQAAS